MAMLDNSGDIILDAVITDTGRMRLAKGDGSFKIVKFALADDEIDYSLYDSNHPSGSAYFDLQILQTPVFEAFTNNIASMNSKLLSISRSNLLYLPVVKINQVFNKAHAFHADGTFVVAVDDSTEDAFPNTTGVIPGSRLNGGTIIRVDQGLDTTEIPPNFTLDADLVEVQYILSIDNRFGKIVSVNGSLAQVSYIDDDNIASYYLSLGTDSEFVKENTEKAAKTRGQTIAGPRGTYLEFQIQSSLELNTSTYLFELLGTTGLMTGNTNSIYYIDSYVRIMGATTGASILVPVRFIKTV